MGLCNSKDAKSDIDYERLKKYVGEFIEIYFEKDPKYSCMFSDFIAGYASFLLNDRNYSIKTNINVMLYIIESSIRSIYPNTFQIRGLRHYIDSNQIASYLYISGLRIKQMP
jgi:hypothetical protein